MPLGPFKYYVTPKGGKGDMLKCYDALQRGEGGCNLVLHNTGLVLKCHTFNGHMLLSDLLKKHHEKIIIPF